MQQESQTTLVSPSKAFSCWWACSQCKLLTLVCWSLVIFLWTLTDDLVKVKAIHNASNIHNVLQFNPQSYVMSLIAQCVNFQNFVLWLVRVKSQCASTRQNAAVLLMLVLPYSTPSKITGEGRYYPGSCGLILLQCVPTVGSQIEVTKVAHTKYVKPIHHSHNVIHRWFGGWVVTICIIIS
jgi:hypothetical protein